MYESPLSTPSPSAHAQVKEHVQAVREALGCEDARGVEAALRDVSVAPKLAALRDLLVQCGVIGTGEDTGSSGQQPFCLP